jgi:hypothetical protein
MLHCADCLERIVEGFRPRRLTAAVGNLQQRHLLADINAAHRREDAHEEFPTHASIEEELEEIERWVAGSEPGHTFGYYCGLKSADFPPAEQLSKQPVLAFDYEK